MAIQTNPNNEDKAKQEKLKALSDALGLQNTQTEIDSLKDNVSYLRGKMEELITSINAYTTQQNTQNTVPTTTPTTQTQQLEKIQQVAPLLDGVAKVVSAWKGTGPETGQVDLVNTIMGAFSKLIQIQIDNAVLNTYPQARQYVKPPDWVTQPKQLGHDPSK